MINPDLIYMIHIGKFYAGNANHPPHYISKEAKISQSLVNEGCVIFGTVEHSVLSYNVHVGKNSTIKDSVIMPNVRNRK